jgi:hypothetical protein
MIKPHFLIGVLVLFTCPILLTLIIPPENGVIAAFIWVVITPFAADYALHGRPSVIGRKIRGNDR